MIEDSYKPHLSLTAEQFPAIKKYDVGDSYSAIIKCRMIGKHDDNGRVSGEFEILSIKEAPKKSSNVDKVKSLMSKGYS